MQCRWLVFDITPILIVVVVVFVLIIRINFIRCSHCCTIFLHPNMSVVIDEENFLQDQGLRQFYNRTCLAMRVNGCVGYSAESCAKD